MVHASAKTAPIESGCALADDFCIYSESMTTYEATRSDHRGMDSGTTKTVGRSKIVVSLTSVVDVAMVVSRFYRRVVVLSVASSIGSLAGAAELM